jgi:hypothetical protein
MLALTLGSTDAMCPTSRLHTGKPASGGLGDTCAEVDTSLAAPRSWLCGLSAYRLLGVLMVLGALGAVAAWLLITFGRMQV